jgi:ATP-dependent Clp protease ATP-binding subunit ClpA
MKVIITAEDIENVVSKMANVPAKTISTTDTDKLKTLEEDLKNKVYGQSEAIEAVVRSIKRSKAGFRKTSKTIANFVFAGRTGTGKSYLAQTLADLMGVKLIRWDMSELQEKNSISKWIGAPAGYIGHDEGGQLVEQIRQNPNAVLLLDEIEKAASDVYNVLLQIMDSATLTDSHGKKADFSNVILIATSNVGAQKIGAKEIGFGAAGTGQAAKDAITKAYEKQFSPEFRNRIDQLIMFNDLGDCELKRIVYAEIDEFQKILDEKKVRLTVEEPVILWLLKNGYDEKMGARPLARLFEKNVKDKLLDAILFGELKDGGQAIATLDGDTVKMMTLENIVDNAIVATV